MDKLTKEALGNSKNLTPEGMEKRKQINSKILKFGCLPILLLFVFVFIVGIFSSDKEKLEKDIEQRKEVKETIVSEIENTDEKTIAHLKREIESIDKGVDFSRYRGEIQSVQMGIILFGAWAKTITEAKNSKNEEVNTLAVELESRVKKIQVKEFPLLRKAYKEAIYQKLWVENIETAILSKRNTTIQFTGRIFANNKNIQETQTTLSDVLRMFRFKRANYKWYKYDDEFTYYDIDTPKDDELVTFK